MKVTNLRRKLWAALAAAGMLGPAAAYAVSLNQNLIANGDFENVDPNTTIQVGAGKYAVKILGWTGGNQNAFAYSHSGSYPVTGGVVANYANGTPPANGGNFYFTANATPGDIHVAGQVTQLIDVSSGISGSAIASGRARLRAGAYFSSYANDGDYGSVYAEFLNGSGVHIGALQVDDNDTTAWTQNFGLGAIPTDTKTVRLSIFGKRITGGGPDGYIDNVDVRVLPTVLILTVNRADGSFTLSNQTGISEDISQYSITSAFVALEPANWKSITDNYDAGSPGPNQVDPIHNWGTLSDPAGNGELNEADLESGLGASIPDTRSISLGNAGAWIQNPTEDLVFQYYANGQTKQGIVLYTGNGDSPFAVGDLNVDGHINTADWVILRTNQLGDLSTKSLAEAYRLGDLTGDKFNDHADFVAFKSLYDAANGAGAFADMLASVPEPSSVLLVLAAGTMVLPALRRRWNR